MGIIEWIKGWKYVGNTLNREGLKIHPNIIKILTKNINKANHQYSGLLARPLKSAYFEKHNLIDSANVMMAPLFYD